MQILEEIKSWNKKPKELIVYLASKVKKDKKLVPDVISGLETGSKVEKGVCAEVMEYVTQEQPEAVLPHLKVIINHLNFDAPRVKWECSRVIGNVAQKYPAKVTGAIPKLMVNAKDQGTVVRWSVAFALTEMAKADKGLAKKLVPEFEKIIKKEDNNGVKNVYLKALKAINK